MLMHTLHHHKAIYGIVSDFNRLKSLLEASEDSDLVSDTIFRCSNQREHFLINWKKFIIHNTTIIKENSEQNFDFWSVLTWFCFIFTFTWFLLHFHVIFIDLSLITSYNAFHDCVIIICLWNNISSAISTVFAKNLIVLELLDQQGVLFEKYHSQLFDMNQLIFQHVQQNL